MDMNSVRIFCNPLYLPEYNSLMSLFQIRRTRSPDPSLEYSCELVYLRSSAPHDSNETAITYLQGKWIRTNIERDFYGPYYGAHRSLIASGAAGGNYAPYSPLLSKLSTPYWMETTAY